MKLVFASISFFTITLSATMGMAQNHLSVQEQLQAIMDRFPGGGMKVQPAVIRYDESEQSRQASEAGEPCLECMGVKRIEVKQIGAEDTRTVLTAADETVAGGVGLIICQNPSVDGGVRSFASGTITGRADVVVTAEHAFSPIEKIAGRSRIIGRYNPVRDCTFNLYRSNSGRITKVFQSGFVSSKSGALSTVDPNLNEDWAVARLASKPPANLDIQPFRVMRLNQEDLSRGIKTRQFSYSHMGPRTVKIYSDGLAKASGTFGPQEDLRFLHSCDTNGVSSGGAMTVFRNGHYYLFGIHTGAMAFDSNDGIRLDGPFYQALQRAIAESDQRNSI